MKYIKESGLLEGGTFLSFLSGGMQIWVVVIGAMIGFVGSFLSVSHVLKERY